MEPKEAAEILKKRINDPGIPDEIREAIQVLSPDIDRMVPMIPFKGRQGTFATYNCGFCHAGISTGSKYCHRCGRKVDLEHSDIPSIKDEIILELPDPEEEIVPDKRRRSKDNDVEGQSSIFDMLEGE